MEHNQDKLQLIKQLSEQEMKTKELFDHLSQYQQENAQLKSDLEKIDKLEKELKECEQDLFNWILNDQQSLNCSQCEYIADLKSCVNELLQKRNNLRTELLAEYENYDRVLNKMTILSKKMKFIKIYDASMNEISEEDKTFTHSLELSVKSLYLQGIIGQKKEIENILKTFKELQEKIERQAIQTLNVTQLRQLHFEVLDEEDREKFISQFLNMLKWSVDATQEDR
ncbi:hypothetical protein C9374_009948 [Naegleria lovaniensis]|uniref:Uncharacterized protein n=1 Tax=Naegleria lovaniensis TaxID=51637 RepID=A0AA88GH11_NAELO|nr:uncharacterized protein C9374_009948 [Naegleria lovaniensis]KAG2375325.1 hypothetical protein C9374_009948 [Naegleria lovaniensis]